MVRRLSAHNGGYERVHSEGVLAAERAAADAGEHSEAQQREVQRCAQDAAQQAEAEALEVIPKLEYGGAVGVT